MVIKKTPAEVITFVTPAKFRAWLARHHDASPGIWLRMTKKDASERTITYAQALDEALCYGWIDAQKKGLDETSWLQRFCPRRPRSN